MLHMASVVGQFPSLSVNRWHTTTYIINLIGRKWAENTIARLSERAQRDDKFHINNLKSGCTLRHRVFFTVDPRLAQIFIQAYIWGTTSLRSCAPLPQAQSKDGCYLAMHCLPLRYYLGSEFISYNGRERGGIDRVYHRSPLLGHRLAGNDQRR
jgi:hypothetical protein